MLAVAIAPATAHAQTTPKDPRTAAERLSYFIEARSIALAARAGAEADLRQARAKTPQDGNEVMRAMRALDRAEQRVEDVADAVESQLFAFVYYALPPRSVTDTFKDFLQLANKARVDQQTGAGPAGGGSTSAAAKTGLATLFGFAMEAGALTQTVEQNVVTVRANADGLQRFLSNQEIITACDPTAPDCAAPGFLKNVELSASFNASDAGTQSVTGATAPSGAPVNFSTLLNQHQFASATARYAVLNHRDLRSKEYRKNWIVWFKKNGNALKAQGEDLLVAVSPTTRLIRSVDEGGNARGADGNPVGVANTQYFLWRDETRAALAAPAIISEAQWQAALQKQLDRLLARMRKLDPDFDRKLADLGDAFVRYFSLRRDLSDSLVTDPALTIDYTYSEPVLQPKLHTVRFAYAHSPQGNSSTVNAGTITVNAAVELFNDLQPTGTQNPSRLKDAQVSLQFDRSIGPPDAATQLSVGAFYQYQINPNIIVVPAGATTLPGTNIPLPPQGTPLLSAKGSILAFQAVMTVRLASSGLKIPLGISWANRTDLVPGNQVRGHVGFTFDSTPLQLLTSLMK